MAEFTRRGGLRAALTALAGLLASRGWCPDRAVRAVPAAPPPRPPGRGETRLIEDLAEAVRAWHPYRHGPPQADRPGDPFRTFCLRVNALVQAEWAALCASAGIRVLPAGAEYYAARDRLYGEHDDRVRPSRVLSVRFCFDVDEYAPVFGPVAALEFPTACLPVGPAHPRLPELLPVVEDPERGKMRAASYYLRRGDAGQRVGAAIAGTLPALIRALEEGPAPHRSSGRLLAVEPAEVYVTREAYMVEFFVYVTAWREAEYPHAGAATA